MASDLDRRTYWIGQATKDIRSLQRIGRPRGRLAMFAYAKLVISLDSNARDARHAVEQRKAAHDGLLLEEVRSIERFLAERYASGTAASYVSKRPWHERLLRGRARVHPEGPCWVVHNPYDLLQVRTGRDPIQQLAVLESPTVVESRTHTVRVAQFRPDIAGVHVLDLPSGTRARDVATALELWAKPSAGSAGELADLVVAVAHAS
jgi:hypothetical protein